MPQLKVPADMCLEETFHYEDNYKTESVSSRSSSPKSLTETDCSSVSEVSESPDGSVISDLELEAERIANDLDNMKITEIQAEEMMKEGMDMRHVLQAAWKLKPKLTKKFKRGVKLNGSAMLKLLNFASYEEDLEDDQNTKLSRAWSQYEKYGLRKARVPPGFENIDTIIEKKMSKTEKNQILVSYANGTNTLNLATEPLTIHDVTVSCVVDTCRGFVQQTRNPTFIGLRHLEDEMMSTYSLEAGTELMRPLATGSVVAVFTDDKWYRCQVVAYNPAQDTADIKFVDHGGYTTVSATQLRQLKSEFLRLPFQAIEVYFAHVRPADHEIEVDIASEILFNSAVSLQLVGTAEDGVPMVQAYYYDGDYVKLFNQEVMDICMSEVPQSCLTPVLESSSDASSSSPSLSDDDTAEDTPPNAAPVEHDQYPVMTEYGPVVTTAPPAYIYTDEAGYQHIYYLTGPYVIMPLPPMPEHTDQHSSDSSPSPDQSIVSCGPVCPDTSSDDNSSESETCSDNSYDFINKPYEEWTQEDYARYYGDC